MQIYPILDKFLLFTKGLEMNSKKIIEMIKAENGMTVNGMSLLSKFRHLYRLNLKLDNSVLNISNIQASAYGRAGKFSAVTASEYLEQYDFSKVEIIVEDSHIRFILPPPIEDKSEEFFECPNGIRLYSEESTVNHYHYNDKELYEVINLKPDIGELVVLEANKEHQKQILKRYDFEDMMDAEFMFNGREDEMLDYIAERDRLKKHLFGNGEYKMRSVQKLKEKMKTDEGLIVDVRNKIPLMSPLLKNARAKTNHRCVIKDFGRFTLIVFVERNYKYYRNQIKSRMMVFESSKIEFFPYPKAIDEEDGFNDSKIEMYLPLYSLVDTSETFLNFYDEFEKSIIDRAPEILEGETDTNKVFHLKADEEYEEFIKNEREKLEEMLDDSTIQNDSMVLSHDLTEDEFSIYQKNCDGSPKKEDKVEFDYSYNLINASIFPFLANDFMQKKYSDIIAISYSERFAYILEIAGTHYHIKGYRGLKKRTKMETHLCIEEAFVIPKLT